MKNFLDNIDSKQKEILYATPTMVGLLIAAADQDISFKEVEWAEKVMHFRTQNGHHTLREYYLHAKNYCKENIRLIIDSLPSEQTERMQYLSDQVSRANEPLSLIDPTMRGRLIDSYRSLALSVAEIDGGIFNFFSSHPEEAKWLDLHMLIDVD